MDQFLDEHKISVEPLDKISAAASAEAWMKYLKKKSKVQCPACGTGIKLKQHFLSDFYIGGFAFVRCGAILTRDRGIYKKYFPDLIGYAGCFS